MLIACLLTLAASPGNWIRRGNEAYATGKYQEAIEYYENAVGVTPDPGQVAYNLAAAYYQMGNYGQSMLHYRQSLEDAAGPRRVRALYGFANSAVQQAKGQRRSVALQLLQDADKAYEECLALQSELEPEELQTCEQIFADARFNRQIGQQLMAIRAKEPPEEEPPPPIDDPDLPNPGNLPQPAPGTDGLDDLPPGVPPRKTDDFQPGKGNLPPLLDDGDAPPLTPAQAEAYLRQAMQRIRLDRATRDAPDASRAANVRDW